MLAKQRRNMFISFRNEPRDMQSVREEIALNVRRGLAKLNSNSDTENDDTETISMQLNDLKVEEMTSKDIYKDLRAHYRSHEWQIRDVIFMKKCWTAICCNSHLFKDKVNKPKIKFQTFIS